MTSITIYADVIVPEKVISAGARGKMIRKNTRTQSLSGRVNVNVDWSQTLRQYECGFIPMELSLWELVIGLYEVTEAGAYGMLMLDPSDQSTGATEGLLYPYQSAVVGAIGVGYGIPTYRLYKRYTSIGSTRTKDRAITRPKANPVLKRGAATVIYGASAGNVAIDTTTGAITFVADASQSLTSITVGATTVLNFADGTGIVAAMSVGQRVYLSGITGTAATTLNGLSHAITAKGATSLTISTVTTGLTATGGTAYKYPQASEALTWSGVFYVPVHFANDEIDWELVRSGPADSRLMAGPTVTLMEVRE